MLATDSSDGEADAFGKPTRPASRTRIFRGLRPATAADLRQPDHDVAQRRQVWGRLKRWKTVPIFGRWRANGRCESASDVRLVPTAAPDHRAASSTSPASSGSSTARQRSIVLLPDRWSEHGLDIATMDTQGHAPQHLGPAVALVDAACLQDELGRRRLVSGDRLVQ